MELESEVLKRWINASVAIGRVGRDPLGGYLTYQIQASGRIDAKLRRLDARYGSIKARFLREGALDFFLSDYLDLARLWVLDAYELVRTLDACLRHGLWTPSEATATGVGETKRRLAEVRVPLAKFEPTGRFGRAIPGDLIPVAVLGQGTGAGWNVGGAVPRVVSRLELSDALLDLLEGARSEISQPPGASS